MNALGISVSSLGLSPEQLLNFGELFAPVRFEQDAKIDTSLNILSQLTKNNQNSPDLFNLFRPLELGDSLNNFAAEALKLFDFSNFGFGVSRDLVKTSDASSLYLSQLSASNFQHMSLSSLASSASEASSSFKIGQAINGGSSLSQITDFQLPVNAMPPLVRPEQNLQNTNQRTQSVRAQLSASPFEAIRRPYEKFKSAKTEKRNNARGESTISLLFRAAKQLVTGILSSNTA